MGCRIRENTWRQCDSKQKRIKLKWRTHAAHTNLQLVVARSSSKSQLKFLFDLANVSDSAGSRRHRWTRDRQPHWRTLSMRERALYMCVCVFVCLSPTGDGTEKLPANMDAHNADQMPTAAAAVASRRTDRRHTTVENWLQVESKQ